MACRVAVLLIRGWVLLSRGARPAGRVWDRAKRYAVCRVIVPLLARSGICVARSGNTFFAFLVVCRRRVARRRACRVRRLSLTPSTATAGEILCAESTDGSSAVVVGVVVSMGMMEVSGWGSGIARCRASGLRALTFSSPTAPAAASAKFWRATTTRSAAHRASTVMVVVHMMVVVVVMGAAMSVRAARARTASTSLGAARSRRAAGAVGTAMLVRAARTVRTARSGRAARARTAVRAVRKRRHKTVVVVHVVAMMVMEVMEVVGRRRARMRDS